MELLIKQACKLLEEGKLISFPTETVYALAANATDEEALKAIYKIKGREFKKPLALLFKNIEDARRYVKFNETALILAKKFCPGPISFVLPKSDNCNLPYIINGGLGTLSVRIPDHKIALAILNQVNCPIVATSSNISGQPDATTAEEVYNYFGNNIGMIINSDGCSGQASTIVDLCGSQPKILREGEITALDIIKTIEQ
jgi:L-threonylcarbamoyladenylate synthase